MSAALVAVVRPGRDSLAGSHFGPESVAVGCAGADKCPQAGPPVTPPLARGRRRTSGRAAHAWGRGDDERGSGAVVRPWPKTLGVALVIAVASLGATPAFA